MSKIGHHVIDPQSRVGKAFDKLGLGVPRSCISRDLGHNAGTSWIEGGAKATSERTDQTRRACICGTIALFFTSFSLLSADHLSGQLCRVDFGKKNTHLDKTLSQWHNALVSPLAAAMPIAPTN